MIRKSIIILTGLQLIISATGSAAEHKRDLTLAEAARKAHTVAILGFPTRGLEEASKHGRVSLVAVPEFQPLEAGASSLTENVEPAEVAAKAPADEPLPVLYLDKDKVSSAFERGAVLLGVEPGRNYQVHASRRNRPGRSEVHALDTDIMYVLSGTATFVTGGTVVDGKTTAPNEIRGTAIRNGQPHRLVPGDIIIIPRGTPHWFQQVDAPFTYYVVKVR